MTGLTPCLSNKENLFWEFGMGWGETSNACAEYIFGSRLFANGTLAAKSTAAANCGVIAGRERMKEDGIAGSQGNTRHSHGQS
jgi:hypothetical protein